MKFIDSTLRYGAPIAWPSLFWFILYKYRHFIPLTFITVFFLIIGMVLTFVSLFSVLRWHFYYRKQKNEFVKIGETLDALNDFLPKTKAWQNEFDYKNPQQVLDLNDAVRNFRKLLRCNPVESPLFINRDKNETT